MEHVLDWLTKYGTVVGPLVMGLLAFINRSWISRIFVQPAVLAAEIKALNNDLVQAEKLNKSLERQAEIYRVTAEGNDHILERMQKLEKYVPKFESAVEYIQVLQQVINQFQSYFKKNGLADCFEVPSIPNDLVEDI